MGDGHEGVMAKGWRRRRKSYSETGEHSPELRFISFSRKKLFKFILIYFNARQYIAIYSGAMDGVA